MEFLRRKNIPLRTHSYKVAIPDVRRAVLRADGRLVSCEGCSMLGGRIMGKYKMISSLVSSAVLQDEANINFNPRASTISKANYYFAPSVAVDQKGLAAVLKAKKVEGEVVVKKTMHTSTDILVGNSKNPEFVCIAHYDSINAGAIDNASGVAVLMGAVLERPEFLQRGLFVFAANEELSYDKPVYWGHGFRVFEKKFHSILERAKRIVVIDSVGNGKTVRITDPDVVRLGFPIINAKRWSKKITFLAGDFDHLMSVYHSNADDGRGMSEKWLRDARAQLEKALR